MGKTISFAKIQKKVDKLHRKQMEAQGAKKELIKEMKALGYNDVSEIKKAADKLSRQIREKEEELNAKLKSLDKMLKGFEDAK